jgi:hypothetical protein
MKYLYTAVGITVWIGAVALSSQALVAHENGRQLEKARQHVQDSVQHISGTTQVVTVIVEQQSQEVVTSPQTNKTITPTITTEPKVPAQQPIAPTRHQREEEDEDD